VARYGDGLALGPHPVAAEVVENDNTRLAYYRAACSFFAGLEEHGIGELLDRRPRGVRSLTARSPASDTRSAFR
jgi:hypothetical protein